MSIYTRGPWEAQPHHTMREDAEWYDVLPHDMPFRPGPDCNGGYVVAACYGRDRVANARLIAAAPDLLASLERIVPWLGLLIAEGAYTCAAAPGDAEHALAEAEALLLRLKED